MIFDEEFAQSMEFNAPLQPAILVRRYKRFLADIQLPDGSFRTVHCPNTGAMFGCSSPGSKVYLSHSDNPKRKLQNTLEIVETSNGNRICVNTIRINAVVKEAINRLAIKQLANEKDLRAEVAIPDESGRFDFGNEIAFVEVKSVTYLRAGTGVFPDARSDRALKHVRALTRRVLANQRGILLFCAPHTGIEKVGIAGDIDAAYAEGVAIALEAGVEVIAYGCDVSPKGVSVKKELPFTI